MPGPPTTLRRLLTGSNDSSIRFADLLQLLRFLGFDERIRGDHHIFTKQGVSEIINVQPNRSMSKVYQVRQVRQLILKYHLGNEFDEQV